MVEETESKKQNTTIKTVSHSELEKWHYQALKHPEYQLEGMIDCMREEMMMNMPLQQEAPSQPKPVIYYQNVSRDEYEQLKGKLNYLTQKIQQHLTDKTVKSSINKDIYISKIIEEK